MSPNHERIQDATLLFVTQLRNRPEQVVANVNCLLEGDGFKLELVPHKREHQNPQEASLFDWQHQTPQEMIFREEAVGVVPPHRWEPPPEMEEAP